MADTIREAAQAAAGEHWRIGGRPLHSTAEQKKRDEQDRSLHELAFCAGAVWAGRAALAAPDEDRAVLWAHLVSMHAGIYPPDGDHHEMHEHEHDGPGTIRNHPRADRSFDLTKMGKVLAEGDEPPALAAPEPQDARYETEDCDHGHERELRRIGYGVMAHGSVEDIEALCSILNGKPLAQPVEVPDAE